MFHFPCFFPCFPQHLPWLRHVLVSMRRGNGSRAWPRPSLPATEQFIRFSPLPLGAGNEGWNPAGIMLNPNREISAMCKYTSINFIKVFKLISEPLHESNRKLSRLFQASPGRRSQRGSAFRGLASREFWPGPPCHGVPSASWMVGAFAADIMRMF